MATRRVPGVGNACRQPCRLCLGAKIRQQVLYRLILDEAKDVVVVDVGTKSRPATDSLSENRFGILGARYMRDGNSTTAENSR